MANEKRFIKGSQCPEARIIFPRFEPKGVNEKTGEPEQKRSMMLAWPKSADLTIIREAIAAAAEERFGSNVPKFRSPLKDADTHEDQNGEAFLDKFPELAGHYFINANSYKPVTLVGPNPKEKLDYGALKSGDYGRAGLSAKWFEQDTNRGVTFYFGNVQKLRDGEAIGGGGAPDPEDEFGDDVSASAAKTAADVAVDGGEEWPL